MTNEEKAQLAWQVLTGAARNRQILTYEHVARRIGMATPGMGNVLEPIMRYCVERGVPPLTVLVVQKGTGVPGPGLTTSSDFDSDREAVFIHNWDAQVPPSAAEFRAVLDR